MNVDALFEFLELDHIEKRKLSGGDINEVYHLGDFVFKVNSADDYPNMFLKEESGLKAISQACLTPKVFVVEIYEEAQYIQMEYIQEGEKTAEFWESFGVDLANLHQVSSNQFGFEEDNYIGSLHQKNAWKSSWEEFLIEQRLLPLIEMAVNSGEVNYVEAKVIEGFYKRINEIYPDEPAALLHGDLWGGNFICGEGKAVLIDPAVYYGHREMDIGMMHLFGGFDNKLFDRYNEVYPLEKNWRQRIKINQIYPLLVHVNLFGRGYWMQIAEILRPFAS